MKENNKGIGVLSNREGVIGGTMETVSGALAVLEVIDLAEKFGWLDRLIAVFKKPMNVVVLGATGAGKSNFLATIQGINADIFDAFTARGSPP